MPKAVTTKAVRLSKVFRHALDPYSEFSSDREAKADSRILRNNWSASAGKGFNVGPPKERRTRVPTLYTMLRSNARALPPKTKGRPERFKFNAFTQGPHTVAHCTILAALSKAQETKNWDPLVRLLPKPADYDSLLSKEFPSGDPLSGKARGIVSQKYRNYYERIESLGKQLQTPQVDATVTRLTEIRYTHTINKAFQAGIYGTYAYREGATKKELAGKGERRGKIFRDFPSRKAATYIDDPAAKLWLDNLTTVLQQYLGWALA